MRNVDHPEWKEDCLRWHGRVLRGWGAHWCWDWDLLPVDETVSEWGACTCPLSWWRRALAGLRRVFVVCQ